MGLLLDRLSHTERKLLGKGEFGLEKEGLRVDEKGCLAQTPHPFPNDEKRDRDFCESQIEQITGVHYSVHDVLGELEELNEGTKQTLLQLSTGREYLWPFSNPPVIPEEKDIPIANYRGELKEKTDYREYLAQKYGKKKMLFSGIHFNFSFPKEILEADFRNHRETDFRTYKDQLYLDLAGKVLKHSWLIVYLTAASPLFDGSYVDQTKVGETILSQYGSARCSTIGYWNQFQPVIRLDTLFGYTGSIRQYVYDKQLRAPSELYYPVRLKPKGLNSLEALESNGVNHIELRMFDLNPLAPAGIDERDLNFVFYLLVYLSSQKKEYVSISDQIAAIRNMKTAALFREEDMKIEISWSSSLSVTDAALQVLDHMEQTLTEFFGEEDSFRDCMTFQRRKVLDPSYRYTNILTRKYGADYVKGVISDLRLDSEED